ncbi:MmcQ/YjbR family DNA-binding protein [Caulobacter sp. SLTY]|uniref:MmcQ/YjbR family DNA-binding protein n=1 Tax=Caulobacter sp. SLTY TaxID=2683262 RepID=UPI0014121F75|nr:MmcQ/YjbR family DNA-binding protein [Caulobacter sp. SLTY]NBB15994.1 MmcQ/YjbR family DNA-binding protein [Caulobacter sp. SLTY]
MTPEEFAAIALEFPACEAGTSYGVPSFKVRGKFFTRIRSEDNSAVIQEVPFDERDLLIEMEPQTFHFTDHYRNYPIVLARLETLNPDQLRGLLERRWRKMVTKAMVREWEANSAGS